MRYLQVISSLNPVAGGPPESVRLLGTAMRELGHEVDVATMDPPASGYGKDLPCAVHALGPSSLGNYGYCRALQAWLHDHVTDYDAVVVNGLWQYHGPAVRAAARRANRPYFVFPHGMLDPWFRKQSPLRHARKLLYWHLCERRVLQDARAVLFTCDEERLLARNTFPNCVIREAVVSLGTSDPPADTDTCRAAFSRKFPQLGSRRFLLFMGRIHPKKGIDLLIHALARRNPSERPCLVIAGPDPDGERQHLEYLSRSLGVTDVVWTGMLSGQLKWGALYSASAFVLPSHQENFGIAVVEALACSLPALISNKVNIWREIAQDEAGLVADDTVDGTVDLLRGWHNLDVAARSRMARNAASSFTCRFRIDAAAATLCATINRHISTSTGVAPSPRL
jgi:glycosyltransferase involved in cell wall biosynthesis